MNKHDIIALLIVAAVLTVLLVVGAVFARALSDYIDKTKGSD